MRPLPPLLGLLPCAVVANYEIFTQRHTAAANCTHNDTVRG
eukprot:COSAG04_NODE_7169_length_1175_cov_1.602230_1_plen_40_part_10